LLSVHAYIWLCCVFESVCDVRASAVGWEVGLSLSVGGARVYWGQFYDFLCSCVACGIVCMCLLPCLLFYLYTSSETYSLTPCFLLLCFLLDPLLSLTTLHPPAHLLLPRLLAHTNLPRTLSANEPPNTKQTHQGYGN